MMMQVLHLLSMLVVLENNFHYYTHTHSRGVSVKGKENESITMEA